MRHLRRRNFLDVAKRLSEAAEEAAKSSAVTFQLRIDNLDELQQCVPRFFCFSVLFLALLQIFSIRTPHDLHNSLLSKLSVVLD